MKLPRILQKPIETITRAKGFQSKNKRVIWENKKRNINKLRQYRNAYENGGYISEALDLYPLYMLSNGYSIQTAEGYEGKKEEVQAFFDKVNLHQCCRMLSIDSLLVMDGIAEIVYGQGSKGTVPIAIYNRPAECFEILEDRFGNPILYVQKYDVDGNSLSDEIELKPENVIHLKLIPRSDSVYGMSLMRRSEDDINRDIDCIEAISSGIKLHGTPKYQTVVNRNRPDAPPLTDEEFSLIQTEYEDINAKDSFVAEGDIDTKMLDVSGVANVSEYSDTTQERVCASMGTPEELVGMRKGSTDATAVSRINAFFKKIQTHHTTLEQCLNTSIIDKLVGTPGKVWIKFNDPDSSDNLKEAQFCKTLGEINPLDPFGVMSAEQMRARLGIDEDEYEKYNETGGEV